MNERIERALDELRPALAAANAERERWWADLNLFDDGSVKRYWAATTQRDRLERAVFALEDWQAGR